MRKIIPYNVAQENAKRLVNASCLISGNCPVVKSYVAKEYINNSYASGNTTVLIIDFCHNDFMSAVSHTSKYPLTVFDVDNTSYDYFFGDGDLRSSIRAIKLKAESLGYSHEQTIQVCKYLELLQSINDKLGLRFNSIQELNNHYYSIDMVSAALQGMLHDRQIRPGDMDRIMTLLQRSAKGNLIIDNILAETRFTLGETTDTFSIKKLAPHSLCHLYVNSVYSEVTSTLVEALSKDISDYRRPLNIIINAGKSAVADRLYELVECVTTHRNYNLLFLTDDIFTDTANNHDRFRGLFEINAFGSHSGTSNQIVSNIFGTRRVIEEHYDKTYDRRLTANNVFDTLTGRNFTEGVHYVPVELPCIRPDSIESLPERSVITLFTKSGRYELMRLG